MKKIAILTCIKSNSVCTGASCLKAMNERTRSFAPYKGEPLQLMAFLALQRLCVRLRYRPGNFWKNWSAWSKSAWRLSTPVFAPESMMGAKCPQITKILSKMEEKGMKVVRGTH